MECKEYAEDLRRGELITIISNAAGGEPVPVRLDRDGTVHVLIAGYAYPEGNSEAMLDQGRSE